MQPLPTLSKHWPKSVLVTYIYVFFEFRDHLDDGRKSVQWWDVTIFKCLSNGKNFHFKNSALIVKINNNAKMVLQYRLTLQLKEESIRGFFLQIKCEFIKMKLQQLDIWTLNSLTTKKIFL